MEGTIDPRNYFKDSKSEGMECYRVIEEGSYDNEAEPMVCYQILEEVPGTKIERKAFAEVEEVLGLCPLCGSEIKYYFMNFIEKILMCVNAECEFPFSVCDYRYKRFDIFKINFGPEFSDILNSVAARLGIQINHVASEDKYNLQSAAPKRVKQKSPKQKMLTIKKLEIKKDLEFMEKRNMKLHKTEKPKNFISNQKWIHKLKNLQDTSGLVLLEPEELQNVSVKRDNEVKLNIEKGEDNNMCSIKILVDPSSPSNA